MRSAFLSLVVCLAAATLGAACKGETVYKDTPDTLDKLANLQKELDAKKSLLQQKDDEIAECQRKATGGEIVVTIEGDALKVKPGHSGGGTPGVDEATTAKQSQAFLDMVQRSRGAIQKCYEQALKKNSALQARTVSLKLSAKFAATGDFNGSSFDPSLGDVFDNCLRTVAGRWKMPAAPAAMTFQAHVSLSPT
jgi:hypothetical protein